jgi:hypothetical protein
VSALHAAGGTSVLSNALRLKLLQMLQSELVVPEQLMQFTLSQVSVAEVKWQILGGETFFRKA